MAAQAAAWLAGLDRGLGSGDRAAFRHWLAANRCHRLAWQEARRIWRLLDLLARRSARRRPASTLSAGAPTLRPERLP